jgi:putative membrane protein
MSNFTFMQAAKMTLTNVRSMFAIHVRWDWLFLMAAVAFLTMAALMSVGPARGAIGRANFLSDGEQQFVNRAWGLDMARIAAGRLVTDHANSPQVRAFGEQIVAYHTVMSDQLKSLADQYRGSVPGSLDAASRRDVDRLSGLSGAEFDRQYMRASIDMLNRSIDLFAAQSMDVAQTPLDHWAGRAVPELQRELLAAERIGREVGVPDDAGGDGSAITAGHKEPANAH